MKDRIPPNQSCENCRYWGVDVQDGGADPKGEWPDGFCKRFPPSINDEADGDRDSWPMTWATEWCGEWRETWQDEQVKRGYGPGGPWEGLG